MSARRTRGASADKVSGPSNQRQRWFGALTLLLIVSSAFGVIRSTHACRELYAELQTLEATRWHLEEEYSRLLLEQSTWASHHRVEKVAAGELGMQAPEIESYKVVNP